MKNLLVTVIAVTVMVLSSALPAQAFTVPSFPSCLNPQGQLIVHYSTGIHGIVGQSGIYQGSDSVYRQNDETLTQCFCRDNGEGIQTNWLKVNDMSQDDITSLERSGWYIIPDGSAWGLESGMYLARNFTYSCKTSGTSTVNSTSSSSSNGSSSNSQSDTQGIGGMVLGLASTGSLPYIYNLWLFGLLFLISGICLKLYLRGRKA